MSFLTRRSITAGASVSAATCLAGCASTNPNPSLNAAAIAASPLPSPANPAMADAVEPNYSAIYAEMKDTNFTVPAIKLAQVDSAYLRKNIAYFTKEEPGTVVINPG